MFLDENSEKVSMRKSIFTLIKLIICSIFLVLGSFSVNAKTLVLDDKTKSVKIGKYLSILEDKKGDLTFDDILKGNHPQKYITTKKDSPNMGFTFSTFWVKFTISNQSEKNSLYYFIYEFPGIDKITLYQKLKGEWVKEVSGDQIPASKKKISHRFFPFKIYPKESSTYYLQIKNTAAMQIPLQIYSEKTYNENRDQGMFLYSVLYGVMIIMAVYHALIYFSTRMVSYLYYTVFTLGVLCLVVAITGFGAYVLPTLIWFNNHGMLLGLGGACGGLTLFLYDFLEIKSQPKYNTVLFRVSLGLALIYTICAFFLPFWFGIRVIIFTIGIPLGLCAWWGVGSFLRKHKSSKYVAYGFLAVISGGFIKLGQGLGLLPTNFLSDNAIYVAIIVQILFFSLGLASLINNLRKDAQQHSAMLADVNQLLERRVKDKTKELREYVEKIEILINNMAQAVFAINPDGIIIDPVSQFSEKIFGEKIEGKSIWNTLYKELDPEDNEYSSIQFGFSIVFHADDLQWLMVGDTFPTRFLIQGDEGEKKSLKASMSPIYDNGLCEKIMFIIEDVTELEKLEADIKKQRQQNALKIEKLQSIVANSRDSLTHCFYESYARLKELKDHFKDRGIVLRSVHTLKGLSRLYGLNFLASDIHKIESKMITLFEEGVHKKSFEEDFEIQRASLKNSFDDALETVKEIYGDIYDPDNPDFNDVSDTIEVQKSVLTDTVKEVTELIKSKDYETIISTLERLSNINIKKMAIDLQNIVINTAKKLDKAVTFNVSGDDSYLPEKSISMLKESFIHLLTNCVDHGIETKGDINVSIKETFEEIKINIKDNGKGINEEKVLKRAIANSILTEDEAEEMNSSEIKHLIFRPSFSTKDETTETSGRGIGMDVVIKNIESLGGKIIIEEGQNIGTSFMISLPHFEKKTG